MTDSRLASSRFQARGPDRVESLPPSPGRASQGLAMTSGLAAMSWSQGRVAVGSWNVGFLWRHHGLEGQIDPIS